MARDPAARILHLTAGAFTVHGFGNVSVGLFDPAVFPEHHGGIGVGVGVPGSQCQAASWLLKSLGCERTYAKMGSASSAPCGASWEPAPTRLPCRRGCCLRRLSR
jgi:hypothetical protein